MRRFSYVLICILIFSITGCTEVSNKDSSNQMINKPALPKDIRAMSAKWTEDRLFYLTDEGVYAFFPSNGSTFTLLTDDISKRDITSANFWLSPDKSKYIFLTGGHYDNSLEIRDATIDKSILVLDTRKYREGVGDYSPYVSDAGWVDNDHIYLSTEFRLFVVNINTGEEVQITEECSPVTTVVSHNTEAPYLAWARNVIRFGNKFYYTSVRSTLTRYPSIYCGDNSGESKLLQNGELLMPADDHSFLFRKEIKDGVFDTFLYDSNNGSSTLISDQDIINAEVDKTNSGKLSFMTGNSPGGIYQGVIYDPFTLEVLNYEVFNYKRDFPSESSERTQFGHFMGALEKQGEYTFLFSIENLSESQQKYVKNYLAYNTKTNKITKIGDYSEFWLVNFQIDSFGEYIIVTKHKSPGEDEFLFDIVKSDNII